MDTIRSSKGDLIVIPGHGHIKNNQYMDLRLKEDLRKAIAKRIISESEYNAQGDYWIYCLLTSEKSNLAILQVARKGFEQRDEGLYEAGLLFLSWWKESNPLKTNIVFIED
jgi:hypothetical protein